MKNYIVRFGNNAFIVCIMSFITYSSALKSYGESCLKSICDPTKLLVCNRFYDCDCEFPRKMIFDPVADSCVTKANETCYLEETWTRTETRYTGEKFQLSSLKVERKTPCVTGAICSAETKWCICTHPLVADQNGICQSPEFFRKSAEFVMECHETQGKNCPENTGLWCVDGFCKCEVEFFQYFNGTKCVSKVNGPCDSSYDCTEFSTCVTREKYPNGWCECLEGYVKNDQGRCDPGYDQPCDSTSMSCNKKEGLKCVDGRCQCSDKLQVYVESERNCLGLVGGHCKTSNDCEGHALCSSYFQSCQCPRKYTEIGNRTCIKSESNNLTDVGKPVDRIPVKLFQNLVPVKQVLVTGS